MDEANDFLPAHAQERLSAAGADGTVLPCPAAESLRQRHIRRTEAEFITSKIEFGFIQSLLEAHADLLHRAMHQAEVNRARVTANHGVADKHAITSQLNSSK
jgi:hypothetical protein